jgi:putative endonuclease
MNDNERTTKHRKAYRQGLRQELFCALLLICKGYRILRRRYRSPYGEIDLVARRGKELVFLEIKYRRNMLEARHAITYTQRQRIERAALAYLQQFHLPLNTPFRFDAIFCAPRHFPHHLPNAWVSSM